MMNSTTYHHSDHFSWVDHSTFALMLVVSTVVGVLVGVCGKQDTEVDYLLGGKKMSVIPISVSLIFSHISGITIMAIPTEYYTYGVVYVYQFISGFITCVLSYFIFLPLFFDLQFTSLYEYLELRFSKSVRKMASFLYSLSLLLYLPIVIYVPALAFNQVTGINMHVITSVVCGVCMLYTMLGGMKAVVWTDFLQSFVTIGSCIAVISLGLIDVGGFNVLWERSKEGGRLDFVNFDPDPFARNTFWTIVVGSTFGWINGLCVNQGMIQKFIALPTLKKARISLVLFYIGFVGLKTLSLLTGLLIYSIYYKCDPITTKQVSRPDQILPFFTMDTASNIPGLPGLFIAGTFSASLSTLSSNFNCLSATIFEDLMSPFIKKTEFFASRVPLVLKSIVVIAGMVCIAMVYAIQKTAGIVASLWHDEYRAVVTGIILALRSKMIATSASGVTGGALTGMFILGMFFPWANEKGCLAGSISSLVLMSWIIFGAQVHKTTGKERFPYLPMSTEECEEKFNITVLPTQPPTPLPEGMGEDAFVLYKLSFHYYCLLGVFIVVTVGMAVSYLTGFRDAKTVDSRLLVSFVRKFGNSRETDAQHPSEKEMLNVRTKDVLADENSKSS